MTADISRILSQFLTEVVPTPGAPMRGWWHPEETTYPVSTIDGREKPGWFQYAYDPESDTLSLQPRQPLLVEETRPSDDIRLELRDGRLFEIRIPHAAQRTERHGRNRSE